MTSNQHLRHINDIVQILKNVGNCYYLRKTYNSSSMKMTKNVKSKQTVDTFAVQKGSFGFTYSCH